MDSDRSAALRRRFLGALLACVLLCSAVLARAETLQTGAPVPDLSLRDQYDRETKTDAGLRLIVLTKDMDGGKVVKEALATDGRERLAAARAVYVADISKMPGLVTKLFAMPSLRKREYPILLDKDGVATAAFPHAEGKATVVNVEDGKVARVELVKDSKTLLERLTPPAQP